MEQPRSTRDSGEYNLTALLEQMEMKGQEIQAFIPSHNCSLQIHDLTVSMLARLSPPPLPRSFLVPICTDCILQVRGSQETFTFEPAGSLLCSPVPEVPPEQSLPSLSPQRTNHSSLHTKGHQLEAGASRLQVSTLQYRVTAKFSCAQKA